MDYRLMGKTFFLVCFMVLVAYLARAQERVTTLGIQFKPMIPSQFFNTDGEVFDNGEFIAELTPRFGHNFGMVVRHGITRMWSIETGISLVQRNFTINWQVPGLNSEVSSRYRFVSYEIPLQGLVYVRLGKQLWMNASGGVCLDMYPSYIATSTSVRRDTMVYDFSQDTFRRRWIQVAILANYGFEWRTRKSGFLYLGASFHRPFQEIAYTKSTVTINTNPSSVVYELAGSYLTVDLRYFFHEDPQRRKAKGN